MSEQRTPVEPEVLPAAGDVIHVLRSGVVVPDREPGFMATGTVAQRGDEVILTQRQIDSTINAIGVHGGIALAADEAEQLERWGEVRFRMGPRPADLERWERGTPEWEEARAAAMKAAFKIPEGPERAAAFAEVRRRYGEGPASSWSVEYDTSASEKAYEREQERRRASGVTYSATSSATGDLKGRG
jgi:hypothetical protein